MCIRVVFWSAVCWTGGAALDAHLIHSLPGYVHKNGEPKPLPTRHWSGYIEVKIAANSSSGAPSGSAFVHYWLVENAAKDSFAPTVVWQQGGPGSSSLIGLFSENGPFTLNDESLQTEYYKTTGIPTVFDNPSSWHAHANMLYVEHPAPTGFSYCVPAEVCDWNDFNQALVSYQFYVNFFDAFPELDENPFYFAGESYAGVLVPTVALQILSHTTVSNKYEAPWNLEGFMLGNDCPGNQIYTCTPYSRWRGVKVALDFRYGHGMIPDELYRRIYAACTSWWSDSPFPADGNMGEEPPEDCKRLLEDPARPCMSVAGDTYQMGGGYYLYDTCQSDVMALNGTDDLPHPQAFALKSTMQDGWRILAKSTGKTKSSWAWDVKRLVFRTASGGTLENGYCNVLHSGCVSDPEHGGIAGYEALNAFRDNGAVWGGRRGQENTFFIGLKCAKLEDITSVQLSQGDTHYAEHVFIERFVASSNSWTIFHSANLRDLGTEKLQTIQLPRPKAPTPAPTLAPTPAPTPAPMPGPAETYPCGQERVSQHWLNSAKVQDAIHTMLVGKDKFYFSTALKYNFSAWSLLPEYKEKLIPNYRILQYSGDADPCVPHIGTNRWIESLNLPKSKPWHPWSAAGSSYIAGYNEIYSGEGVRGSFTFATVRNAGHMVPRYKPVEALHLFQSFLGDTALRGGPNPRSDNTAAFKETRAV